MFLAAAVLCKTIHACYQGMANSISGATNPDLRTRLDVNTEEFSRSFAAGSVGGMLGSVLGVMGDKFRSASDGIMSLTMTIAAVTFMLRPWSTYLEVLIVLSFVEGCAWTCMNASKSQSQQQQSSAVTVECTVFLL